MLSYLVKPHSVRNEPACATAAHPCMTRYISRDAIVSVSQYLDNAVDTLTLKGNLRNFDGPVTRCSSKNNM